MDDLYPNLSAWLEDENHYLSICRRGEEYYLTFVYPRGALISEKEDNLTDLLLLSEYTSQNR